MNLYNRKKTLNLNGKDLEISIGISYFLDYAQKDGISGPIKPYIIEASVEALGEFGLDYVTEINLTDVDLENKLSIIAMENNVEENATTDLIDKIKSKFTKLKKYF